MAKLMLIFALLLILLSVSSCDSPITISNNSPSGTASPCKDGMQDNFSWDGGVVLTLNDCLIKDIQANIAGTDFLAGLISSACGIVCKAVLGSIAYFLTHEAALLVRADDKCNGQGAIIEIGSFNDKTLWTIKEVCGTNAAHLTVIDNNKRSENNLRCDKINLSFTVKNTGEQAMKWHLAIYFGDTNIHPISLLAYIGKNGFIHSGKDSGSYDERGLIPGQSISMNVRGSIEPDKVQQYGPVTLSYIGSGGDNQNPPTITLACS